MAKSVGRPSKYKSEYAEQVYKLCLLGATDISLSHFFNISEATLNTWKKKHPEFLESIRKGKEVADAEVANALYNRALGYSHPEEKIFSNAGEIVRADTMKHYPPDTGAAFIWLKNRAGWKDKAEVEHTVDTDIAELLDARRKRAKSV